MSVGMMVRPLAQYLAQFGAPPPAEALGEPGHDAASLGLPEEPADEDPAISLQAAHDEGMAEGYALARREYEAQLLQEKQDFEVHLDAERERWTRQESDRVSGGIKAAFAELEANIAGSIERILEPLVVDALRSRMIDLLAQNVGILLGGRECPIIEIHGPEDLLAALRDKLAAFSGAISYSPGDSTDVRIVAGQTMIESRLEMWLDRIKALSE